ncbi:unnamed protein product [Durusdinium trenchii]|uniref:Uncharacterized protein n=1 Tax=Durusdinium trenchii TaxID=1381693 RepID=A0ABP0K338_9DINO
MVCNLHQNPGIRPIVSFLLPTLLRRGLMWVLLPPSRPHHDTRTERYLLDKEHLHGMGLWQYPQCTGEQPYPLYGQSLTESIRKSLAGNAMHMAVVGSLWSIILTHLVFLD